MPQPTSTRVTRSRTAGGGKPKASDTKEKALPVVVPKRRGRKPKATQDAAALQLKESITDNVSATGIGTPNEENPYSVDEGSGQPSGPTHVVNPDGSPSPLPSTSTRPLSQDMPPANNRHYNTRPTNEAHPARRFGLEKRTQEEISYEASRKRTEREDAIAQKRAEVAAERAMMERKLRELAEFENSLKAEREGLPGTEPSVDIVPLASPTNDAGDVGKEGPQAGHSGDVEDAAIHEDTQTESRSKKRSQKKSDIRQEIRATVSNARSAATNRMGAVDGEHVQPVAGGKAGAGTKRKHLEVDAQGSSHDSRLTKKGKSDVADKHTQNPPPGLVKGWRDRIAVAGTLSSQTHITQKLPTNPANKSAKSSNPSTQPAPGLASKPTQLVTVVEIGNSEAEEDVVITGTAKRKPRTKITEEKSRSVQSLPSWAQEGWHKVFVPTLLDMAGCHEGDDAGWEIERDKEAFLALTRNAFAKAYPNVMHGIDNNSIFVRIGRQMIVDWRRRFYREALNVVSKAMNALNDAHVRREWSKAATTRTGVAFWGTTDVGEVEAAFASWTTGQCEPNSHADWKYEKMIDITQRWNMTSVEDKCVKPHRFERFMTEAHIFLNKVTKRNVRLKADLLQDDREYIRDPSSPAPMEVD
ncbi:hypothetical protein EIP86_002569 [Pleurotus ostreatoroseus]|nr:hypothetical protein EIP86_002569 [Pleurotus ostreatoroseus]